VPAWRSSRRDLWTALKPTIGDSAHRRFQSALCAVQVALCTVLLVFAGLVTRTLSNLRAADKGIDPAHIAIFSIDPRIARYTSPQAFTLRKRLLEGAQSLPGVDAAAIANFPLMRGIGWGGWAIFPDRPPEGVLNTSRNMVTRDYFDTLSMHFISGRGFDLSLGSIDSRVRKPAPVVVNQAFVRKFFPGRNPLGQVFAEGRQWVAPEFEVIGVVNDTKYRSMREVPPPVYYSEGPGPDAFPDSFVLHVRAHGDPRTLIPSIRQLLASIDPRIPLYEVATLTEEIDRSLWQERLLVALASCFGTFAIVLSAMGLYGILAYFVASRRREIGLRMALGAEPVHVGKLLAKQLMPTLIGGLAGGAALSLAAGTWVRGVLYDVGGVDARSVVTALAAVLAVAIVSAATPALRAIRVDPASTLRQE
jgi:predicted permease